MSSPTVTNPGQRYDLGYVEGEYYGVWDRTSSDIVERFPLSDEGWTAAWRRWQSMGQGASAAATSEFGGVPETGTGLSAPSASAPMWRDAESGPVTRPGGVTAAAVILIILGALACIFGLIAIIGAFAVQGLFEDFALGGIERGTVTGVLVVVAILLLGYGVTTLISGIKTLGLNNAWRVTGIVMASIGAAFWLLGFVGSFSSADEIDFETSTFTSGGPNYGSMALSLAMLALNVVVIVLLAKNGRVFTRR
ncbi:MAG: hypothetical protein H0W94_04895 [Actinobacteria bacterium]|nr:hypothetical protein [Actinomycetota bacterium]